MLHRLLIVATCAVVGVLVLGGCKSSSKKPSTTGTPTHTANTVPAGTSGPAASPTAGTPVLSVGTPTVLNPDFGRTAIDTPAEAGVTQSTLTQLPLPPADNGEYDRAVFQFDGGIPGFHVDYVTSPTSCASGETPQVQGQAFLEVRITPAVAHNESGQPTIAEPAVTVNLPSLTSLVQTCDYEGTVTWVMSLKQKVDFRAFSVASVYLVVDVHHP